MATETKRRSGARGQRPAEEKAFRAEVPRCPTCQARIEEVARWPTFGGSGYCPDCEPAEGSAKNGQPPLAALAPRPSPLAPSSAPASREAGLSTATPAGIAALNADGPVGQPPEARRTRAQPAEPFRFSTTLESLARNRFNPRERFDEAELDELAESLKKHGQLQPILVRAIPDVLRLKPLIGKNAAATDEIVAGERRALAAVRAGWSRVTVERIGCDDARACELAIAENRDRRDISQVEYARGLFRLAELRRLDPAGLAKDQGLSEQHVRNLLRLLDAPPAWQQRVVEGVLSGTHLRHALPFLHVEAIEKDLARHLEENQLDGRFAESEKKWRHKIEDVVRERGAQLERAVHGSDAEGRHKYGTLRIDAKHPQWAELQVVEIPARWGGNKEKIALNAKLCRQLLKKKADAWHARNGGGKAKAAKADQPTKAEQRRQRKAAQKARREKLQGIVSFWLSWLISRGLADSDDQELMLRVCLAANYGGHAGMLCHQSATAWALEQLGADWRHSMALETPPHAFFDLDAPRLRAWIKQVAVRSFWPSADALAEADETETFERRWWPEAIDDHQAQWLAGLQIKPAEQWRAKDAGGKQQFLGPLTEAWLDLHDRDQLDELAAEWKVPVLEKDSEADLRRKLTGNAARVMPLPAELAEFLKATRTTKGAKSTKRKAK